MMDDLNAEFDSLMIILRQEFIKGGNIGNFLNTHQRISQLYTRKLQVQIDSIPFLTNKQVKEIIISASPEAVDLLNAARNAGTLEPSKENKKVI